MPDIRLINPIKPEEAVVVAVLAAINLLINVKVRFRFHKSVIDFNKYF